MKVIVIKEDDIRVLMERLELEKLRLQGKQKPEEEIHRHFHYVVVS